MSDERLENRQEEVESLKDELLESESVQEALADYKRQSVVSLFFNHIEFLQENLTEYEREEIKMWLISLPGNSINVEQSTIAEVPEDDHRSSDDSEQSENPESDGQAEDDKE